MIKNVEQHREKKSLEAKLQSLEIFRGCEQTYVGISEILRHRIVSGLCYNLGVDLMEQLLSIVEVR